MPTPRKFDRPMTRQIKINLTPDQLELLEQAASKTGKILVDVWRDAMVSMASVAITGQPGVVDPKTLTTEPLNPEVKPVEHWKPSTENKDDEPA